MLSRTRMNQEKPNEVRHKNLTHVSQTIHTATDHGNIRRKIQNGTHREQLPQDPSRKINPPIITTTREIRAVPTRLMTGHSFSRLYLYRIPTIKITSPPCPYRYGGSDQTPEHLVLYCQNDNLPAMRERLEKAVAPMHLVWGQ